MHEIFSVCKYEEKIKLDKIWGNQMGIPFKRGCQNIELLNR